jgi:uncharacterized membrane protein
MYNEEFLISVGYCVFMLMIALIVYKFPPKKINHLYGYRTSRSMKNETVWNYANSYSNLLFIKICLWSFIFPVLSYFIFPEYIILITIVANTLLLVLMIILVEMRLNKLFDKNGNPK